MDFMQLNLAQVQDGRVSSLIRSSSFLLFFWGGSPRPVKTSRALDFLSYILVGGGTLFSPRP